MVVGTCEGNRNKELGKWSIGIMCLGILFGTIGLATQNGILGSNVEDALHSNGNGTGPWLYFTVYTIGIVFLSYYLGGVFNSQPITEDEYASNSLLRLKSQLALLPISQLIRKHTKSQKQLIKVSSQSSRDSFTEQRDILTEAILEGYVFPWYIKISDDRMFPTDSRQIIHMAFDKLREKIENVNRTKLAVEAVQTFHCHWTEYCCSINRIKSPNELLISKFRLVHPYIENREEVAKQYESLISILLPELLPQDLHSQLLCKFLSGILVKGIFLYYAEVISDPKWVNTMLVTLISAGNYVNTYDTSSNQSGSNISTAPPSPSRTPIFEQQPDTSEGITPSTTVEDNTTPPKIRPLDQINSAKSPPSEESEIVIPNKGSLHNFLRVDSKKRNQGKKSSGCSPVMNSIQAALSNLLSATALPLLPDGTSYTGPDQNDKIDPASSSFPFLENKDEPTLLSSPEDSKKEMTISFSKEKATFPNSPSTRHKSWEESTLSKSKAQSPVGTATAKSLDESQTQHTVTRQAEFDFGGGCETDTKGNVPSPMYEEPEDFAATIAKLRSLLEQRESQTNVVEGMQKNKSSVENRTTSPPVPQPSATQPLKTPVTKVRPSLDSQSSASSLNSDASGGSAFAQGSLDAESKLDKIDDDEEEVDPVISRFFLNVSITKTESCGESSSDQFTLYCIQYEGVYIEEDGDEGLPKLVLRTTTVKRSFKEFLLLQSQLEDSPIWKPHLRGIKMPNKWLNLSFSNNNSNHRRQLLERYLQQISSHPVLGFCPELRHFMAYGDDGFQMFGLPPFANNHLPRFDKLTKTFTGVLNSLRDALPSFESELQGATSGIESQEQQSKGKKLLPSFLQFGDKNLDEDLKSAENNIIEDEKCVDFDDGNGSTDGTDSDHKKSEDSESDDQLVSSSDLRDNLPTRRESTLDTIYPLASAVTKLLCDVLWLPHQKPHAASIGAVLSVSGKSLENYLQESLDILFSEEAFLGYLEWLTTSVQEWAFTGEKLDNSEKEEVFYAAEDLKLCLKQRVPIWVRWMWGKSRLELTIDRLVEFFQTSTLNHDFVLSIVELIFSKLTETSPIPLPPDESDIVI